MKISIFCCILFIHVNMCLYIHGFRVSVRVSGIHGFGFGDEFPPESVSGFGFGCTETPPDPNPTRCHPYMDARGYVSRNFSLSDFRSIPDCIHIHEDYGYDV